MQRSILSATVLVLLAAGSSSALDRGGSTENPKQSPKDARAVASTEVDSKSERRMPGEDEHGDAIRMVGSTGAGPSACPNPGANPITGNSDPSVATSGIACASGGISTPNSYARVFTQEQLGPDYTINCVNFGMVNTGSAIQAILGVYIDPTGGAPSVSELSLIASYTLEVPTGESQLLTATFDPFCVQLTGSETLVVVVDYGASSDGFCSFAGGTGAVSPTYIRAAACGVSNFVNLAALGFANYHWFVELSGDFGCEDGIVGDLNLDGIVDGADLSILLGAWGTADPIADLSGDGNVDGADLSILLGNWS